MSDLDVDFAAAATTAKGLPADPGNEVKLRLYALYKQASSGDVTGGRPGFANPVGRAKHDAWASMAGTDGETAKTAYIALVNELLANPGG